MSYWSFVGRHQPWPELEGGRPVELQADERWGLWFMVSGYQFDYEKAAAYRFPRLPFAIDSAKVSSSP